MNPPCTSWMRAAGRLLVCSWLCIAPVSLLSATPGSASVGFNRDILPVLSDNCFFCHGPDQNKRKGKLRLDVREDAIAKKAIVPGKPNESELIKRILTSDEEDLMPPPDSHKKLSPAQKDMLARWVREGAAYEGHWAYVPPVKPPTPTGTNGIDFLVSKQLIQLGLEAAPEADRRTLARRLYFDCVGLPPKPDEVEEFERDNSPQAYSKLADKLLASPHYGEQMAIQWLDVVRFADTDGYHADNARNIWPYRDYVIKAFNENKPFDEFSREQMAGDLLPNSTQEQKVASAFNRLLLSTEEGGAQPKDYEARMLTDRVRAVGTVWLGQTIGCAQCHDHKFDPIKARDFYSMGAFFADITEPIIARRETGMLVPDNHQAVELARLDSEAARLQKEFDAPRPELAKTLTKWEKAQLQGIARDSLWTALKPAKAKSLGGAKLEIQPDHSVLVKEKNPETDTYTVVVSQPMRQVTGLRIEALPDASLPAQGPGRADNGDFVLTEVTACLKRRDSEEQDVLFSSARASSAYEGTLQKGRTAAAAIDGNLDGDSPGWGGLPEPGKPHQILLELAEPLSMAAGDTLTIDLVQNHGRGHHTLGRFRIGSTTSSEPHRAPFDLPPAKEIVELLTIDPAARSQAQEEKLMAYYKSVVPELVGLRVDLAAARKAKSDFEATVPRCVVSVSSEKPRTVRILPRGNFLIETGEIVEPALPGYLAGTNPPGRRLNRLDLAEWLVSRENPLTSRVVVNRLWKQFFGIGLSKVLDDFGAQGEPPANQALLDWLACEFMDSGWDVKHMVRLIVNSAAYKRTSAASKDLRARDPGNRTLAAQTRWRLDAELVRDNALAISGLLVTKIGGASVKPYQPAGYWENLNFPPREYEAAKGEDQYRRGLYTWWQRSFLHPSMVAFDAPSREECVAERNRSNIPQQALVLLNDPSYVEASRAFATRILKEGGPDVLSRIDWAWRQGLSRPPREDEVETAKALFQKHLAEYQQNAEAAKAFLKVGQKDPPTDFDPSELAAWTSVARVILNLHETITRS